MTPTSKRCAMLALLACVLLAAPVPAVEWDSLSVEQQEVLGAVRGQWDGFDPERQARLLRGAERWLQADPQTRSQAARRLARWNALPPERQAQVLQRFERFRALPPERQQALRQRYEWFRSLPPDRQRALRERWRNMSPEARRKFLREGPPAAGQQRDARDAARARLQALPPAERARLRKSWQQRPAASPQGGWREQSRQQRESTLSGGRR